MTLQAKELVPDFVPASTAAVVTARRTPAPTPLANVDPAPSKRIPPGPQAETALEAPAGMWGY